MSTKVQIVPDMFAKQRSTYCKIIQQHKETDSTRVGFADTLKLVASLYKIITDSPCSF